MPTRLCACPRYVCRALTTAVDYREIVGEYGTKPLYRMLGYFSLIGLLRVHSLLGDFTLALKVMESVELNQKVMPNLPLRCQYLHSL